MNWPRCRPKRRGWSSNTRTATRRSEYISALANAAALEGKAKAYLLWGVDDTTHALVGTHFNPAAARVGAEELESWLLRLLAPKIGFRFHGVVVQGQPLDPACQAQPLT